MGMSKKDCRAAAITMAVIVLIALLIAFFGYIENFHAVILVGLFFAFIAAMRAVASFIAMHLAEE